MDAYDPYLSPAPIKFKKMCITATEHDSAAQKT
jgi:hypothetical protein